MVEASPLKPLWKTRYEEHCAKSSKVKAQKRAARLEVMKEKKKGKKKAAKARRRQEDTHRQQDQSHDTVPASG